MNLDLMMVLSMRQKEMAYQQSTRLTPMPPPLACFPPASAAVATNQYGLSVSTAFNYGMNVGAPLSPVTPGFSAASAKGRVGVRGSISPLSVGGGAAMLPLYANTSTNGAYDQFGFTWHWIARVAAHFALQRQSAHLAIQYAHVLLRKRLLLSAHDAFVLGLSNTFDDDVFALQRELQLLGIACIFMAAKIEEVHPPKATDLAAFLSSHGAVKCTSDDLVRCESEYLKELNWNLHPTTPLSWLLFLLAGDSAEPPLDTMGDFVNPRRNLSGTKELFVQAVRLVDIALLDAQAVDFLPSVVAGSALLLVDSSLDFLFVAQFLQLDPTVLWDCKTWLYGLVYSVGVSTSGVGDATKDRDRWLKVADEELLFIQTHVATPTHLAFGLLRTVLEQQRLSLPSLYNYNYDDNNSGMHSSACSGHGYGYDHQQLDCGCALEHNQQQQQSFAQQSLLSAPSPSSLDNYGCLCKGDFHTCGGNSNNNAYDNSHNSSNGPHVYHFKYGWQGVDGGLVYDAAQPQEIGQSLHAPMRFV